MLERLNKNKAQAFLEYAALIIVLVGALIAMRIYFTRAVQGKYAQVAQTFGGGELYSLENKTTVTSIDAPTTLVNPANNTVDNVETCQALKAQIETLDNDIYGPGGIVENINLLSGSQGDLGTILGEMNSTEITGHDATMNQGTTSVQQQIDLYKSQIQAKEKEICELMGILKNGCPGYEPVIQTKCQ